MPCSAHEAWSSVSCPYTLITKHASNTSAIKHLTFCFQHVSHLAALDRQGSWDIIILGKMLTSMWGDTLSHQWICSLASLKSHRSFTGTASYYTYALLHTSSERTWKNKKMI